MKQSELNRDTGNAKIGILLFLVVALIFSITIVKLKQGSLMQGYDHIIRQNMLTSLETAMSNLHKLETWKESDPLEM